MSGTTTYVGDGETFTGYIAPSDEVVVESGGSTGNTDVAGAESVLVGGSAGFVTVESGGTLTTQTTDQVAVNSKTASVSDATVENGGNFINNGVSSGTAVYGVEKVFTTLSPTNGEDFAVAYNDTVHAGGTIIFGAGSVNYGSIIEGGVVDMTNSQSYIVATPTFSGPGGVLELSNASNVHSDIGSLDSGDYISIANLYPLGSPELTVVGDDVTITHVGGTNSGSYSLTIDGASSDNLVLTTFNGNLAIESVCFLGGTSIATPGGGRAIETMHAGDLVLTADGLALPVRWLGRQTIATRFADPLRTAPIRIRRDALGDGLPVRDLHVSPDHALMVDGVFVQAGALVNGVSITREDRNLPESFVYFHLELADHSLILAEGVPAETFIDNVDRLAFDNWDEHAALDDATTSMREMPHPRAKAHRQVPAGLRAKLLARGCALAGDALAASA